MLPAVLVASAVAAYAGSFRGVFLFDDLTEIVDEPRIRALWPPQRVLAGRRPVVDLTLALNYAVGGLTPWHFHAVNLLIHVLAGLTLYGLIRRTLERGRAAGLGSEEGAEVGRVQSRYRTWIVEAGPWLAFATALIWLVHPLNTQAVTYIIQRAESLMGLLYLLTLFCLVRGVDSPRPALWFTLAVVACGLGMGSKAVMVTAPLAALLYDWALLTGSLRVTLRARWPLFLGLCATWSIVYVCGVARAVLDPSRTRVTVGLGFAGARPWEYLLTQPEVLLHYLRLTVWPVSLCLDYDWDFARSAGEVGASLAAVALLLAVSLFAFWRAPPVGFLGVWFFLILAPTSSVIPTQDAAFEHRMYLPSVAVIFGVVASAWVVLRGLLSRRVGLQRVVPAASLVVCSAALGWKTFERNRDYGSAVRMWADVVTKRSANARGWYNLGKALEQAGRTEEAVRSYRRAIREEPTFAPAYFGLGSALSRQGRLQEAVAAYRDAIQYDPRRADVRCNLGNVLVSLGRYDEALRAYGEALAIDADNVNCLYNLGSTWLKVGRYEKAAETLEEALTHAPEHFAARCNLGIALLESGRVDEAIRLFQDILREHPRHANTYTNLGLAFVRQGRLGEAAAAFRRALEIDPGHVIAREELEALAGRP